MKEKLPINKSVLVWARTSLSLSQEDVAQRLGKDVNSIIEWELGTSSPTYPQLERLAHDIYKRPVAVFFFPEVPKEESPKTEFRTLPETIIDSLPLEIVRLYRKAKLFQLNLEELYENKKPSKQSLLDLFELDEKTNLVSFAGSLRKTIGKSIEEQSTWQSAETAFKQWRTALESKGIFVFKDAFENDEYSGFCLYDERYPIIFVNNSMPETRQVFTLFHELGHLLYRSGGIDFKSSEILKSLSGSLLNIEVSCNRFANFFLVPPDKFDSFAPEVSESHFKKLSDYFSVSREVILRNYLNRGLVDEDYYEKMAVQWATQAEKKKVESGGNYYYNQKAYLGENYIHLAYGKYYQNKITVDTLAEYLNVKPKNLPTFEHFVMEGGKAR